MKVISINQTKKKSKPFKDENKNDFEEIMKKNREKKERLAKERANHNRSVTRMNRLK